MAGESDSGPAKIDDKPNPWDKVLKNGKAKPALTFVKKYRDRHGKLRFYYRPTGAALPGMPGSQEFMAAYHAACGDAEQPELTVVKKTPRQRTESIGW